MSAELGLIVTGQGTAIDASWKDAPDIRVTADVMSEQLPEVDIFYQLQTIETNPPTTTLETHTLMAGVVGYALDRLRSYADKFAVASGHSLGLTFSPYPFGFYTDGLPQLAAVVYERGKLLTEAQNDPNTKGAMYAVSIHNDPHGFSTADKKLLKYNSSRYEAQLPANAWVACYNAEGPKGTHVTITARPDVNIGQMFEDIAKTTLTSIATPAHSPLISQQARVFSNFLEHHQTEFNSLPPEGTIFLSDHHTFDNHPLTATRECSEIVTALGSISRPVRFQETVTTMVEMGVEKIILVGSKSLETLIKRMPVSVEVFSIDSPQALDTLETQLQN
jgi:malonyl CoA-acyl carrier protein transacylase